MLSEELQSFHLDHNMLSALFFILNGLLCKSHAMSLFD